MERIELVIYRYICSGCHKARETKKADHGGICRKCKANQPLKGQESLF